MGFIDLEVYNRINRKALCRQVLRMYDVGDSLLGGVKSMLLIV